ncbi:DUF2752 domain-containing protein [Rhodohalobacter mucosus]|uniref:DUF2752 domain-containing protein n=1 Tax=Rhodohalobacter mucosus TaxID=2079485 RepID=A0A316TTY7_9BACT|nr:DUF2752 domain-containing protein [Rhodohalobacter mucosus]PWN07101.1 hypothetical protein DDZ15_07505 [Rhodohalobacter mucosus]
MVKFKESFGHIFFLHFEWIALAGMLIAVVTIDPDSAAGFCLIEWTGVEHCPGEGIGRSMSSAMRGDFVRSFQLHPAGIPAIIILTIRIGSIFNRNSKMNNNKEYHENI